MFPKLGIIDFHPIQYRAPLYRLLEERNKVDFDVLFLSDRGYRSSVDPGFGVLVAWDIDLLAGYSSNFLGSISCPPGARIQISQVADWLRAHDLVLIHGYSNPWMLLAMAMCRSFRIPYLLRGDSQPQSHSVGLRRYMRDAVARTVVSASAGNLAVGLLNEQFYRKYGARNITLAPYSVDGERFACAPTVSRDDLLARWGLKSDLPLILFSGKLIRRKRPLDLAMAVLLLRKEVNLLFVGDGVLADSTRALLDPGHGNVTGFVNQSELPSYYHAADIIVLPSEAEPWGLVVNEAMAAGTLPVVSNQVGAGPDLVNGLGEIYPCGDVYGLAEAMGRALARVGEPEIRDRVRERVALCSMERTAIGFEEAIREFGANNVDRKIVL